MTEEISAEERTAAQEKINKIVIANGGDPHLLNVVSDCMLRYLQEHPQIKTDTNVVAINTLKMFLNVLSHIPAPLCLERGLEFDDQGRVTLDVDTGDFESPSQMLELQRSIITNLNPGVAPRPIYDLTIYVGDGDRAEDLTFHGMSRGAIQRLGAVLLDLAGKPIDGEA